MNFKPMSYEEWKQQAKNLIFKTEKKVMLGMRGGNMTVEEYKKIVRVRAEFNQILIDMEV